MTFATHPLTLARDWLLAFMLQQFQGFIK